MATIRVRVGRVNTYDVKGVGGKEPTVKNAIGESPFWVVEKDKIFLNGKPIQLDDTVKDGDVVMIYGSGTEPA